jgi:hypothetical protein
MDEIEAFRVLIRRLAGETPHSLVISRILRLKSALARVVKPLGIDKRLIFMHCIDEQIPPSEWLVVKVKASGQLALFEDWIDQLEQDLEARREAAAALNLARAALHALRRLAAVARLTPVQFHEILQNPDPQEELGIQLGVAPNPPEQFVLRDPAGRDAAADFINVPRRVTLDESRDIVCKVELVGTTSALVRLASDGGGFRKSRILLCWGQTKDARRISHALHRRSWNGQPLTLQVRNTLNAKGKIVRLEWVGGDL